METVDFKKEYRELYSAPRENPCTVDVPPLQYLMADGSGNPIPAPVSPR